MQHGERLFAVAVEARRLGGDDENQLATRPGLVLGGGRQSGREGDGKREDGQKSFHGAQFTILAPHDACGLPLLLLHDQLAADELDAVAGLEDGSPDRTRDRRDCATLPSQLDGHCRPARSIKP